jgi:hypothetical protein
MLLMSSIWSITVYFCSRTLFFLLLYAKGWAGYKLPSLIFIAETGMGLSVDMVENWKGSDCLATLKRERAAWTIPVTIAADFYLPAEATFYFITSILDLRVDPRL